MSTLQSEYPEQEQQHWWWMSFCDPDKPKGQQQFIGACIVRAADFIRAVIVTKKLRINPGGELVAVDLGTEMSPKGRVYPINKLMDRAEIESYGPVVKIFREEEHESE